MTKQLSSIAQKPSPIIFMHIPKTAGTSFRIAAIDYYRKRNVLNDYGAESNDTSPEIMEFYYQSNDVEKLRNAAANHKLITGHFPAARYRKIFNGSPIVTFLRDPITRVLSEYHHFRNLHGFAGTLRGFYTKEMFCNRQVKLLEGMKLSDFDFVGITEQYELSLSVFNEKYDADLQYLNVNRGQYGENILDTVSKPQLDEIIKLNQADIELYQEAKDYLSAVSQQSKCG